MTNDFIPNAKLNGIDARSRQTHGADFFFRKRIPIPRAVANRISFYRPSGRPSQGGHPHSH